MDWQDLLAQKDFEALNEEEKKAVLEHCSQEEYEWQRQAIWASQALWAAEMSALEVPPPPNQALQALKNKQVALVQETPVITLPWWQQWANYSIPLWKVAVVALLFFCLQQVLPSTHPVGPSTAWIERDTVYLDRYHTTIEKVLQPADTIIKVVYRTIDTVATAVQPVLASVSANYEGSYQEEEIVTQEKTIDLWEPTYNEKGQALNQDTFLQELTRQVVSNNVFTSASW